MIDADDRRHRVALALDRPELHPGAIRRPALLAATLLILFSSWLAIGGTWRLSRDLSSAKGQPAVMSAAAMAAVDPGRSTRKTPGSRTDPLAEQRRFYTGFATRYFRLYESRFAPFGQADDRKMDAQGFDARFVGTSDHLRRVADGTLDFARDRNDLEALLAIMTEVATRETTEQRLRAYQLAGKIKRTQTVSGTRQERYCSYYGYYINSCISYDTRTVPYSRTVEEVLPAAGVTGPADLFAAYHDRFIARLSERHTASEAAADTAGDAIVEAMPRMPGGCERRSGSWVHPWC